MAVNQIELVEHLRKTKLNLLTHSSNHYPHIVAYTYLQNICGNRHNGFVITQPDNIEDLETKIRDATTSRIFAYPYSDNNIEDLEYLQYADSVIIFDSLFMMIGDIDDKEKIHNFKYIIEEIYKKFSVVIFIVDSTYDQADINKLAPYFVNNMSYLSDNVLPPGEPIESKIIDCKLKRKNMTNMQIAKIDKIVNNENIDSRNWTNDKLYTNTYDGIYSPKRFFNVVYPFKVAETIDSAVDNDEGLELVVNLFGIDEFLSYMPKMKSLYDDITLNKHCKSDSSSISRRLIFTGYPINLKNEVQFGEYGGDLIYNLLINKEAPIYDASQVMRLYVGDPVENIKKFNSDPNYKILIANAMPAYAPQKINHFHIMDTNLETAFELIDVMFKNNNYDKLFPSLDIHLHYIYKEIGEGKDKHKQETLDSYDFKNLRANINKFQEERKMRWNFGLKVSNTSIGKLVVTYPSKAEK
jgi:hypothetical protein